MVPKGVFCALGRPEPSLRLPFRIVTVKLVRGIERRLEKLIESPGRVLGGGVSLAELEARLNRAGDLTLSEGRAGVAVPNRYELTLHPRDARSLPEDVTERLSAGVERNAAERGWRLDGPAEVTIRLDESASRGAIGWSASTEAGELPAWAKLVGESQQLLVRFNRSLIGRDPNCDLVIPHRQVSRVHALIWREGGSALIEDRDSTNGTFLDGFGVPRPTVVKPGTTVTLGPMSFVFDPL